MNEFDPMKESSSSTDSDNRSAYGRDTYTATDATHGNGAYTNPDGSHGFIYNADAAAAQKTRCYRSALIAVSAILATTLLLGCCLFGAHMAFRSLGRGEGDDTPAGTTDTLDGPTTSDGLYIAGTTADGSPSTQEPAETPSGQQPSVGGNNTIQTGTETAPPFASITKLPAKRTDRDGDGRAEIETDDNGQVLTSAGRQNASVATVVARVADSVVEITTETLVQSGHIGQYITGGAGSGVIISSEGFIVTNHHVINGANTITVRLTDGSEYAATLVGSDEETDVAVLWIDVGGRKLTVATLGASFDLVVGEDILAIGNPLGSLGGTVTEGMVSATARRITVGGTDMTLLQVSAPINPGNSGGGLFNLAGELIGVVNAKVASEEIEGLGFAIPIDTAYEAILELIDHGYVRGRPAVGFQVVDVTSVQTAMRYFDSFYTGVYVYDKDSDEVQYGDLILSADGVEIASSSELSAIVKKKRVGDTVELVLWRNKEQVTVTVTLVESVPTHVTPTA